MPAPRKYDEETWARAVRMYQERIPDLGESKLTARRAGGGTWGGAPDLKKVRYPWTRTAYEGTQKSPQAVARCRDGRAQVVTLQDDKALAVY